ncbi:hypothetical protein Cni_G03215 [Canna indica]|uniref:Uncharacterized protein n=1 Tax=Canna indica TaxID=4628 RepID=A0AAQ3JTI1_9LILI|nr:hypothetical protein Cni_G03215 [Canna indica]
MSGVGTREEEWKNRGLGCPDTRGRSEGLSAVAVVTDGSSPRWSYWTVEKETTKKEADGRVGVAEPSAKLLVVNLDFETSIFHLVRIELQEQQMEEEKATANYNKLSRKGEGAARFKQGLGFSSVAPVFDSFPPSPRHPPCSSPPSSAPPTLARRPTLQVSQARNNPQQAQKGASPLPLPFSQPRSLSSPSHSLDRDFRRRRSPSHSPDQDRRRRSPSRSPDCEHCLRRIRDRDD